MLLERALLWAAVWTSAAPLRMLGPILECAPSPVARAAYLGTPCAAGEARRHPQTGKQEAPCCIPGSYLLTHADSDKQRPRLVADARPVWMRPVCWSPKGCRCVSCQGCTPPGDLAVSHACWAGVWTPYNHSHNHPRLQGTPACDSQTMTGWHLAHGWQQSGLLSTARLNPGAAHAPALAHRQETPAPHHHPSTHKTLIPTGAPSPPTSADMPNECQHLPKLTWHHHRPAAATHPQGWSMSRWEHAHTHAPHHARRRLVTTAASATTTT